MSDYGARVWGLGLNEHFSLDGGLYSREYARGQGGGRGLFRVGR